MVVKLKPFGDRVLVRPTIEQEVTKGGLILPDTAREKPQRGEVIAVGPGWLDKDGKRIAMEVKKGDKVLYSRYAGTEIKLNDEEYLILRETDILAKFS